MRSWSSSKSTNSTGRDACAASTSAGTATLTTSPVTSPVTSTSRPVSSARSNFAVNVFPDV
jgi:hypothetical protein